MFGIRTTRLFPARSQRPWLRGRRRVSFSDLARAAEAGDADAVEGLLSLVLSDEEGDSGLKERALASLEDLLGDSEGAEEEEVSGDGGEGGRGRDAKGRTQTPPEEAAADRPTPLSSTPGVAPTLARLEVQAQCFELVERDSHLTLRMPVLLLRAASHHAQERGYHVTGERIMQALAARRRP